MGPWTHLWFSKSRFSLRYVDRRQPGAICVCQRLRAARDHRHAAGSLLATACLASPRFLWSARRPGLSAGTGAARLAHRSRTVRRAGLSGDRRLRHGAASQPAADAWLASVLPGDRAAVPPHRHPVPRDAPRGHRRQRIGRPLDGPLFDLSGADGAATGRTCLFRAGSAAVRAPFGWNLVPRH